MNGLNASSDTRTGSRASRNAIWASGNSPVNVALSRRLKPGAPAGKPIEPFTSFYVYEHTKDGWLLVGAGADGKTQGYLREAESVPWRHAMTLSFAQPTNRERVLFFRDRNDLLKFVNSPNAAAETQRISKDFAAKGSLGPNSPVVAAEPERFVDLQKQFYLLPVLEASTTVLQSGFKARTVKVASITRDATTTPAKAPDAARDSAIVNFNSAVVFIIDATSSMQPYIESVGASLREVIDLDLEDGFVEMLRASRRPA